ncbi:MAG: hypothetical protein IV092_04270 [Burkholderiaceae bacterium]|nr:hypothetical protein [Burkholderiaceae bacterium]MBT9500435.1 hypothetical protein [Burkholderiaceae bacterium]
MKRVQRLASIGAMRLQRGVSMLFSLIAVVVLTLGAVALVRTVDTGALVLGNLGFKQDALAAGSVATERAIAWLQANVGPTLDADNQALGYYQTSRAALDPTGRTVATAAASLVLVDWDNSECAVPGRNDRPTVCLKAAAAINVGGGNVSRYVITRLCEIVPGSNPPLKDCAQPVTASTTTSSQRGSISYSAAKHFSDKTAGTYYRIVTRTVGVRGTVAYAETLVHF